MYFTPVAKTVWKCGLGFSRDTTLTSTVAKAAFFQKIVQAHFVEIFARFVLALDAIIPPERRPATENLFAGDNGRTAAPTLAAVHMMP
jgi:hypothetical protein